MSGSATSTDLSAMMQGIISAPPPSAAAPAAAVSAPAVAAAPASTMGDAPVIDVGSSVSYSPSTPIGAPGSEFAPSLVGGPGAAAGGMPTTTAPKAATSAASAAASSATTPTAPATATSTDLSGMMQSIIAQPPEPASGSQSTGSGSQSTPANPQSTVKGPAKLSGGIANLAAGGNDDVANTIGGLADLPADAVNLGIRGINAGARALGVGPQQTLNGLIAGTQPAGLIPQIPTNAPQWIDSAMGLLGADPRNVQQSGTSDTVMRDIGSNVVGALLPLGAAGQVGRVADALGQAAPIIRGVAQTMAAPSVGSTALSGLGAGLGQAAAQYAVSPQDSELAGMIGQLAGGGVTALGEAAANGLGRGFQAAGQSMLRPVSSQSGLMNLAAKAVGADVRPQTYTAPTGETFTASPGQMALVRNKLSTDSGMTPGDLDRAIPDPSTNQVPGTQLSMAAATGNRGLARLQKTLNSQKNEMAAARAEKNNAKRLQAMRSQYDAATFGSTAGKYVADTQAKLTAAEDANVAKAQAASQAVPGTAPQMTLGGSGATGRQVLGDAQRTAAEAENKALRARTSRFAQAIDPHGNWTLEPDALTAAAQKLRAEFPEDAGEDPPAALAKRLDAIANMGPTVRFKALQVMRQGIGDQIRKAQMAGEANYARQLGMLRDGIDGSVADAVAKQAAKESPSVTSGAVGPDDAIVGRLAKFEAGERAGNAIGGTPITAEGAQAYSEMRKSKVDQVQRTAGVIDKMLKRGNGTEYQMPDSNVGHSLWNGNAEAAQQFKRLVGDGPSEKLMGDYAAYDLWNTKGIQNPDGSFNNSVYQNWMKSHSEQFSVFPGLKQRFGDVMKASQDAADVVATAKIARTDALQKFQDKAGSTFLTKAGELNNPMAAMDSIMGDTNSSARAGSVMRVMRTDGTGNAVKSMHRNALDWMIAQTRLTKPSGVEGDYEISRNAFAKILNDPQKVGALTKLAGADSVRMMRAILNQLNREAFIRDSPVLPGSSVTATDTHALEEHGHGGEMDPSVATQVVGVELASEGIGHVLGFAHPAVGMAAKVGTAVTALLLRSSRTAGLAHVDDLLRAAADNPELGRLFLQHPPPAARTAVMTKLAGMLGNLSVSGYITHGR